MIRGADLRMHMNRKLSLTGNPDDYLLDPERTSIILKPFNVHRLDEVEEGEGKYINAGETVVLESGVSFRITDRVALLKVHPALYKAGVIVGQEIVDPGDHEFRPSFRFEADNDIDLQQLEWLCKVYISG